MINFKFCMLEFDQNILSKIRMSNISWFQNNKKTRKTHASMKWWFNPKTKWWPMRFHKKIIDGATLFSDFQTIISVLSLLIDKTYARDDLLLTPPMITSSTKLAFYWLTSTLDYWNSCNYSCLISGLCRKKKAVFFFFFFAFHRAPHWT